MMCHGSPRSPFHARVGHLVVAAAVALPGHLVAAAARVVPGQLVVVVLVQPTVGEVQIVVGVVRLGLGQDGVVDVVRVGDQGRGELLLGHVRKGVSLGDCAAGEGGEL